MAPLTQSLGYRIIADITTATSKRNLADIIRSTALDSSKPISTDLIDLASGSSFPIGEVFKILLIQGDTNFEMTLTSGVNTVIVPSANVFFIAGAFSNASIKNTSGAVGRYRIIHN